MKKTKKGFTLIELVIVIAVVAVLAGILIPTFASLIKRAKVSSDTALVKNLNSVLSFDENLNGRVYTAHDAFNVAFEGGYSVEKLTPTTGGYDILWDSVNNRFVLIDEAKKQIYPTDKKKDVEKYDLWAIRSEYNDEDGYSIYLSDNYNGDASTTPINATTGIDVGNKSNINISYSNPGNKKEITFRTTDGTLTINAPNDNVNHYGTAGSIKIIEVAEESYHEYGKVIGNMEVFKGRIELETVAEVSTILVSSVNAGDVKIDVASGAKIDAVAPTTDAAKTDITDATTVPTAAKITEIIDLTVTSKFAGGLGTVASPYLIAKAAHLENVGTMIDSMKGPKLSFKLINNIIYEKTESVSTFFNGYFDGNYHNISFTSGTNSGMLFEVAEYLELKNITIFNTTGVARTILYGASSFPANYTKDYSKIIWKFTNVDYGDSKLSAGNKTLSADGNNQTGYINFSWCGQLEFDNCDNYYNYVCNSSTSAVAAYVGGYGHYGTVDKFSRNESYIFKNCTNYGDLTADYAGLFFGNGQNINAKVNSTSGPNINITIENCETIGLIKGFTASGPAARNSQGDNYFNELITEQLVKGLSTKFICLKDSTLTLSAKAGEYLVVTQANNTNTVKYAISYVVYAPFVDKLGGKGTAKTTVQIDVTPIFSSGKYTTLLKQYSMMDANSYKTKYPQTSVDFSAANTTIEGYKYIIDTNNNVIVIEYEYDDYTFTFENTPTPSVSIFDINNELIGSTLFKLLT